MSGYAFTTIADPLAGRFGRGATGVNNAGQIVAFYVDNNGHDHACLYSGGSYSAVELPGFHGSGDAADAAPINDTITLQATMLANLHARDFHFV